MTSYTYNNSYYPPPQHVNFPAGPPPPQPNQQRSSFSRTNDAQYAPSFSNQNSSYNPYAQQAPPQQSQELLRYPSNSPQYAQAPASAALQHSYSPQQQQPSYYAPSEASLAPVSSQRQDLSDSSGNTLRAPTYERRHSSHSTHSHHSHRSSKSNRSSRSRYSEDGRHYITKTGEVIDVESLDKPRSYGDSVFSAWNALKGVWGRREV